MTQEQQQVHDAVMALDLDDIGSELKFSDRLARENGWSKPYTLRVIREYKRFVLLCKFMPGSATPSDQVDQAWHLHMIYTRSYWKDLCRDILQSELHHGPTKGGHKERMRFADQYAKTRGSYHVLFGEYPPTDIWPDLEERFAHFRFERVNRHTHWVIPKLRLPRLWPFAMALLMPMLAMAQDKSKDADYTWIFWLVLIVIIVIAIASVSGGGKGSGSSGSSGCGGCCGGCGGCGD